MNALIAGFREALDSPDLKVLIGKINPESEKHKYVSIVQDQIDQVANEDDRVFTVSAEGISKKPDNIHYDSAGQIELGERFGHAWLEMGKTKIGSKVSVPTLSPSSFAWVFAFLPFLPMLRKSLISCLY